MKKQSTGPRIAGKKSNVEEREERDRQAETLWRQPVTVVPAEVFPIGEEPEDIGGSVHDLVNELRVVEAAVQVRDSSDLPLKEIAHMITRIHGGLCRQVTRLEAMQQRWCAFRNPALFGAEKRDPAIIPADEGQSSETAEPYVVDAGERRNLIEAALDDVAILSGDLLLVEENFGWHGCTGITEMDRERWRKAAHAIRSTLQLLVPPVEAAQPAKVQS